MQAELTKELLLNVINNISLFKKFSEKLKNNLYKIMK